MMLTVLGDRGKACEALRDASEELKGDRELCTAAVAQDGKALAYVAEELKQDRIIVEAAKERLQRNGVTEINNSSLDDWLSSPTPPKVDCVVQ